MKLQVLHLITTLSSGGAEAMLYKLLACMSKEKKIEHAVASLTGPGIYGPRFEALGIPVYSLRMDKLKARGVAELIYLLKTRRPDILQTWLYHADFLGTLAGRLVSIPKIVWNVRCSDMDLDRYSIITRSIFFLLSKLSGFPDAVIVNSRAGKRFHTEAGYRPARWEIIPNGFDTDRFRPDCDARTRFRKLYGIDPEAPVIGMVARFDPMKDHANFFTAAGILKKHLEHAAFVLVGKGIDKQNREIMKLLYINGLNDGVLLLGERTNIHDILPSFDICALSSAFGEGFPNVLGEAMSCGVPCAATDVGDSAFLIGDTGRVAPPGNPEAIARAWLELLSMSEGQQLRIGAEARKRIVERYSIPKVALQYEKLYNDLSA